MLKRGNKRAAEEGYVQYIILAIILALLFLYILWDKVLKNAFG